MRVGYLLSDFFPYQSLLSPDAGPAIANEYGWQCCNLTSAKSLEHDIIIVDNRHHLRSDLAKLSRFIKAQTSSIFFLRVNDPYFFHLTDEWYQFCKESIDIPNVHFLTPYQPTGLLSAWLSSAKNSSFVYAPFTYDIACEIPVSHDLRLKRIAVSGNYRQDLYPKRTLVHRASKLHVTRFFLKTTRLQHPGYPENTGHLSHQIIGSQYVQWLSRHVAAFVDSSIYRVEFLKYREIAYAGCAPVGDLPWSLNECPHWAFSEIRGILDLFRYHSKLSETAQTYEQAINYRNFMRKHRSRSFWRKAVTDALKRFARL